MEQLPNGDVTFRSSNFKGIYIPMLLIVIPVLVLSLYASIAFHTVDMYLLLMLVFMLGLIFGGSYLMACKMKRPPYIIVHADSLELDNRYGPIRISLRGMIGFTITRGSIMNAQMLVLITKDLKKEHTRCFLGILDTHERNLFIETLQAKGFTYFPPDRISTKDGK